MKIVWFNWKCWFHPDMGGAEVLTMEISKRLVDQGHEVILFTSEFPGSVREEISNGVKIVRAGSKYNVHRHASEFYRDASAETTFDVIIDGINTRPFLAPTFASHDERIFALIFQLAREYWFYETSFPISLVGYYLLERKWLRPYRKLPTITISKSTQDDLLDMKFKRTFIISVGTNVPMRSDLPSKTEYPTIVFDGRLSAAKRPDHILKAFHLVRQKFRNSQLWIVGDGPMRSRLLEDAEEGVTFFGRVEHSKRIELIEKSWILVNPSIREGFGLNIINANRLGTPAVGYDVPGLRDSIVPNLTGLLVKSGDINALAQALTNLISDERLRKSLGINALQYSKDFSWDESARQFLQIITNEK
jgi:glycosyltransferase involved in cell wall biosynthesis